MEGAKGYDYTHFDCPYCGDDCHVEGDIRGEIVECESCKTKVEIY